MDTGVYAAAHQLVTHLDSQLQGSRAGAPITAVVHPGNMVPDYHDMSVAGDAEHPGEGLAWARVVSISPVVAGRFPAVAVAPLSGGQVLQVSAVIELGVTRCYWGTEDNSMPHPAYLDSMARDVIDDAAAMRAAALGAGLGDIVLGPWTPRGPLGGAYGGTMTVTVLVDTCAAGQTMPPIDAIVPRLPQDPRTPPA